MNTKVPMRKFINIKNKYKKQYKRNKGNNGNKIKNKIYLIEKEK